MSNNLPVKDPDLGHVVPDPGIEEHVERFADVDEGAGNRAYRAILIMLGLVPVLAIAFVVIYFVVPKTMYIDFGWLHASALNVGLGTTAGLAVLLIGIAVIQWARVVMGDEEMAEERHTAASSEEDRAATIAKWNDGVEQSGVKRRPLLLGALGGAVGFAVIPGVLLFADMGPWPTKKVRAETIEKTIWAEDIVLVNDENWVPLRPEHLEIGQLVNAQPANLAYSKICTHVGCPISLWERQTHHLLCPCHQSTFDLGNSGTVVFGPAARALPQLPIRVNEEGYLVAQSDFTVPVGPSYFERDSRNDFQDGDE